MSDFDKTLHAQLRHLIDDLTVAVDDDGHTRYAPKNTLMFSNFIGALIELMPTLAARAQPAQAVPVLTDEEIDALYAKSDLEADPGSDYGCGFYSGARWAEQAVRAKLGAVPIPDHELVTMYDERPTSDLEMIEFAREVERRHGIVGKEGA